MKCAHVIGINPGSECQSPSSPKIPSLYCDLDLLTAFQVPFPPNSPAPRLAAGRTGVTAYRTSTWLFQSLYFAGLIPFLLCFYPSNFVEIQSIFIRKMSHLRLAIYITEWILSWNKFYKQVDRDIESISLEHVKEKGEMNILSLGEMLIPEAYAYTCSSHNPNPTGPRGSILSGNSIGLSFKSWLLSDRMGDVIQVAAQHTCLA